jgi:hypothetical protein
LMPMLPSGLTSGRSLCVEPATPMSAPGWRSATRARGGVRRRDSPAPNLCDDLRYFAVRGKSYKYEQIIMKVHNVDEQEGGALRVTAERGGERKLRPAGHRTYMLKYLYKRSLKTKRSPVR